ncbi:MAG: hypothetical protein AAGA96_09675 [Verrucomicrobiota bacterium]
MSDTVPTSDNAKHRDRSIRLAVLTSLISKSGTVILRLVSIPIAISQLSLELFGVYTAITMVVGLVDMLHVGIGPALTRELSKALAQRNREKEKTVFTTSILLSTGLTLLTTLILALLILKIPIPSLFGQEFASVSEVMYRAVWIGLVIICIEVICMTFEMARDGYLETRYSNCWGAAGNITGALLLLSGIWFFPTIEFLLIAVNGSIAFAKLGNTIQLLIQRPYLFPRFKWFRQSLVPSIALNSIRFSVTYMFAAALEYNLVSYLIGRAVGPSGVAVYNVMVTIHFSLTGLIVMFTRPYWPALMDAYERKDLPWIDRSARKLQLGGLGFSLLCGLGLITLGPWALTLWAGSPLVDEAPPGFKLGHAALAAFSLYFVAHIWRHIHLTLALGVGEMNRVVFAVLSEGLILITVVAIVLSWGIGITAVYLSMAATMVLITLWMLPLFFRRGKATLIDSGRAAESPSDDQMVSL